MSTARDLLDDIAQDCELDIIVMDGLDDALIGVSDGQRACYCYDKIIGVLMARDGMDEEEAVEFCEFNIVRAVAYFDEGGPIIVTPLK